MLFPTVPAPPLMSAGAGLWDTLRKEARRLEAEVDGRLAACSRLGPGASDAEAAVVDEVDALLGRLQDVNAALQGAPGGPGDARAHTLARHREVLAEYRQEFRRLRGSLQASREHAALLAGPRRGGDPAALSRHAPRVAAAAPLRTR